MDPATRNLLLGLYAEWRRLTEIEGTAISEGAWPEVDRQQNLKRMLREQLVRTLQRWNSENAESEAARRGFETEFRPIVAELIVQETRNQELLGRQRRDLESRLATVRQSGTRLRGLQRAYGTDAGSRWQSWS